MVRTPSIHAHGRVLDAALRLFAERGIDETSMDAIAQEAGVSKATIYKHWADKEDLCLEALAYLHGGDKPWPVFDSGDVRADMIALLSYQPPQPRHCDLGMRITPHLIAYAARNPSFGQAWKARVYEPPRLRLREMLEGAIAQRQLPRDLDFDLALALLLGPLMYCHVLKRMQGKEPENLPEQVVSAFWRAYAIMPPLTKRRGQRIRKPPRAKPS